MKEQSPEDVLFSEGIPEVQPVLAENLVNQVKKETEEEVGQRSILIAEAAASVSSMEEGNKKLSAIDITWEDRNVAYERDGGKKIAQELDAVEKATKELVVEKRASKAKFDGIRKEAQDLLDAGGLNEDKRISLERAISVATEEESCAENDFSEKTLVLASQKEEIKARSDEYSTRTRKAKNDMDAAVNNPRSFAIDNVIAVSSLDASNPQAELSELRPHITTTVNVNEFLAKKDANNESIIEKLAEIKKKVEEAEAAHILANEEIERDLNSAESKKEIARLKTLMTSKKGFFEGEDSHQQKKSKASQEFYNMRNTFVERKNTALRAHSDMVKDYSSWFYENEKFAKYHDGVDFRMREGEIKEYLPELNPLNDKISAGKKNAESTEISFKSAEKEWSNSYVNRDNRGKELEYKIANVFKV